MRIVNVVNFQYNYDARSFDSMDQKIQHGLVENGFFSYAFPAQDIARQRSWRNSKKGGEKKMNEALIETCIKVQPDILILGHGRLVHRETIERIKERLPQLKVIQWFCDWVYSARRFKYQFLLDRLDLIDSFFLTTAGEKLAEFDKQGCQAHFIPNIVHPHIERHRAFEQQEFDYDLIFMGTDRKDPERREILTSLQSRLQGVRFGVFGSLEQPGVYGLEKQRILERSKASLNLTRLPEPMLWYSSDRIGQTMGNGLLTCTHTAPKLDEVYGADALLTYESIEDLVPQIQDAVLGDDWRETAQNGWEKIHQDHNAQVVTAFMIEKTLNPAADCFVK